MSSDIDFDSLAIKKNTFSHISYNCLHFESTFKSTRNTTDESSPKWFAYLHSLFTYIKAFTNFSANSMIKVYFNYKQLLNTCIFK